MAIAPANNANRTFCTVILIFMTWLPHFSCVSRCNAQVAYRSTKRERRLYVILYPSLGRKTFATFHSAQQMRRSNNVTRCAENALRSLHFNESSRAARQLCQPLNFAVLLPMEQRTVKRKHARGSASNNSASARGAASGPPPARRTAKITSAAPSAASEIHLVKTSAVVPT